MVPFFRELKYRNRLMYYFGWVNLICAAVCILLVFVNDQQVLGINAWIKPAKFFISTTIFCWTMGWLLHYLQEQRKTKIYSWMVAGVLAFENTYITIRAARAELSHFNVGSAYGAVMFSLMGVAITVMTVWTAYIAWLFFRRTFPALPGHYLWGIRFGLLFFIVFALGGHFMASSLSHTVGAPDGGSGIPFVNWSKEHGDLRIAHFLGMHSLQILPLLGWYVSRRSMLTVLISIIYFLVVTAVFLQALAGRPLIHFYFS